MARNQRTRVTKHDLKGHKPDDAGWPTPLDMFDLRDAVNEGKEEVTLSGVKFEIFYEADSDRFYVSPVKGFVPCGWFNVRDSFAILK